MKMLTVSFILCVMMDLTRAAALPDAEVDPGIDAVIEEFYPTDISPLDMVPMPTDLPFILTTSCADGWTMLSFGCVLYVPTNMTWAEAQNNCLNLEGTIEPMFNSLDSGDIRHMLQSAGNEHGKAWIGGFNTDQLNFGYLMDSLPFYDLCPKEHKHDCLLINFGENEAGCVDGMDCEAKLPSICGRLPQIG